MSYLHSMLVKKKKIFNCNGSLCIVLFYSKTFSKKNSKRGVSCNFCTDFF